MNLYVALFASVFLMFAVYNFRFRKVLFWVVGVAAFAAALAGCDARPKPEPKPARQRLSPVQIFFAYQVPGDCR